MSTIYYMDVNGDLETTSVTVGRHSTNESTYALLSHVHDYSASAHTHGYVYATSGHDHGYTYATSGHDHGYTYATSGHDHDTTYSTTGHAHDETYSATGHAHEGVYLAVAVTGTPEASSGTGTAGVVQYDGDYIYVCVDTDTWVRASTSGAW